MKESLVAGIAATARIDIDAARTIDFMGDEGRVYATPELVRDIEMTCRDLLLEHLDDGEDSVGTRVEIDHIGATLMGMWVEISVTVTGVEGRAVSFEISARDNLEDVARGKHNRFVVDVAKTAERLKGKAAKAGL
jgi:predicted thioesterase